MPNEPTVFSQEMELLPQHVFRWCIERYRDNHKVQRFSCMDRLLCMGFAQLTYRESLRYIETCLRTMQTKLYHMGIRGRVARSTLAEYALDSTTIDLCLSLFPWARSWRTKAAVKLHTLLNLRGSIPEFIHISDGKLHDVNVLDILVPQPALFILWTAAT